MSSPSGKRPTPPTKGGGPAGRQPGDDPQPWYQRPAVFVPLALAIVLGAVLLVTALSGDDADDDIAQRPEPDPVDDPADDEADPDDDPDEDADPDLEDDPEEDDPEEDDPEEDDPTEDIPEPPEELGTATSTFVVGLSWENELDDTDFISTFRQGQEGATGTAILWLNAEDGVICADLTVEGLDEADSFAGAPGAHLHRGTLEQNGPVAVAFTTPDDETGRSVGCFTEFADGFDALETVRAVEQLPEDWYVNIHSNAYPAGVVRGQLPRGGQNQLPSDLRRSG